MEHASMSVALPRAVRFGRVARCVLSLCLCGLNSVAVARPDAVAPAVSVAVFDVDATPPVGAAMAYGLAVRAADLPLRCRGIVLLGAGDPIVLCCLDWIGIGNEGHSAFRTALAEAAGTRPDRVAVHTTHAHDAPHCDFTAERLVGELGSRVFLRFDGTFHRTVLDRAAAAVRAAIPAARTATHWGFGRAPVAEVASNRRILGADGKVRAVRSSNTVDPAVRAEPEGLVDPDVACLAFWNDDTPLAVITAYACHPQSYYRTGVPSPDFPGIARFIRSQDVPGALHVHFDGAGGNVTAGKYNDGAHPNRTTLALRLAAGMRGAFDSAERRPLVPADVGWSVAEARLEPAPHLDARRIEADIRAAVSDRGTYSWPDQLAWLTRAGEGRPVLVTCLRVGTARMLHLPGELFVEFQLAARGMRPDLGVMLAAYGDLGPGYIGTAESYAQGGYETQPRTSFVDSRAERVLLDAMRKVLEESP